jgi:hypothetical protein
MVCDDDRMGLGELSRRLRASTEELHHEHLRSEWDDHPTIAIAGAPERESVCVGGEVQGVQVVPRAGSPWLEVSVHDGTGRAVAIFTGRRSIGGITPGRRILLEGVARHERSRVVLMNPAYTLLP